MLSHFYRTPECEGLKSRQMSRQTNGFGIAETCCALAVLYSACE